MSSVFQVLSFTLTIIGLLLMSGCGGPPPSKFPTSKVTGIVTIDGTPVEKGQLNFMPTGSGQPASAEILAGKYEVKQAPRGQVRVLFTITRDTGKMNTEYSQPVPIVENIVPQAYRSGIEINVTDDSTHDFELKSK